MQYCSAVFGGSNSNGLSKTLLAKLREALEDVNASSLGVKLADIPTSQVPCLLLNEMVGETGVRAMNIWFRYAVVRDLGAGCERL
jgi:hypothetical protein